MEMISEFVVLQGSLLEGMKLEEIVKKYNVTILHYHSPKIDSETRNPYNPKIVIEPYFLLKAIGLNENIRNLRLDSVKYNNN